MVKKRPHIATVSWVTRTFDESLGRMVESNPQIHEIKCRMQFMGADYKIRHEGNLISVAYKAYCDRLDIQIPIGATLEYEGRKMMVIYPHYKQTNTVIWLD